MHVRADRDRCCGSGNCVMTVPEVFDQDDAEGLVLVRNSEVPPALAERVRQAAELCPAAAIDIDESEGEDGRLGDAG